MNTLSNVLPKAFKFPTEFRLVELNRTRTKHVKIDINICSCFSCVNESCTDQDLFLQVKDNKQQIEEIQSGGVSEP